ncbi:MAG: CotH kinase family protein [Bacteroidales bacterium]|nr:CotH kinase family protein [Bacteroidales bacterium]
MKNIIITCIIFVCESIFASSALCADPVSEKLSATVIGTEESVDYSDNSPSTSVNTKHNAFDGDKSTFFASFVRTGGWVGLDLGEPHIITKIAYCPRYDWAGRLLLGVFEGANNPDFTDAIPIYLITETPQQDTVTEREINCSKGFRYVRYIGPNDVRCNIAEVAFWGYKGEGNTSNITNITNIPAVVIHTENAVDINDPYKDVYRKGIVSFISADGTSIYTDSLEIKGRGNASWDFPKKPYRMKLFKKARVFDLPANAKNWTLINNWGDKTLMRNLLAFDLSKRLELGYTSAGLPVNVFLNGEYKGCYQLCDQIEVGDERVNIKEMKTTDTVLPKLSGGYFIEIDAYAYNEISWFNSNRGIPVTIKSPKDDEIVPAQTNYIRSYFNEMETALFSGGDYGKYIDIPTFIRHFLVGELSGNTDTYWSVYMYKDRNEDAFRFGPVWDFDLAFENDNRTYPINQNPNWIYATSGSTAGTARDFVNKLLADTAVSNSLKSVYACYRDNGTLTEEALVEVIDNYAEMLDKSQKLNFTRWNILNQQVHKNPKTYGSYAGEVENVRTFVINRLAWMDNKLSYTPANDDTLTTGMVEQKKEFIGDVDEALVLTQPNKILIQGVSRPLHVSVVDITGATLFSKNISSDIVIPAKKGLFVVTVSDLYGRKHSQKCLVL